MHAAIDRLEVQHDQAPIQMAAAMTAIVAMAAALTLTSAGVAHAGDPPSCITWENKGNGPAPATIDVTSWCNHTIRIKIVVPWGPDIPCFDMKPNTVRVFNNLSLRPIQGDGKVETC
jgi:hypothetical protein